MNLFVTKFTIFFLSIFFPILIVILIPFSFTYNASKLLPGIIILGITSILSFIVANILLRKYDSGSFSPLKTSLSLVSVFGIMPIISFVPLIIIQGSESFLKIISIIGWLFMVVFPVYIILRVKNSNKSKVD